jgi:protein tyrosine phosphatase (PTP) superfamily phosphohydrolase (DUF442 family)
LERLFMEKRKSTALVVLVFALLGGITWAEPTSNYRPVDWAHPVRAKGFPDFYRVSDDLYRSGQPVSPEALENLGTSTLRIKTVVDLRRSQSNRGRIGGTGLLYERIPMVGWPLFPKEEQVVKFLQIATDHQRTPILVHCQHGADRTGVMCAVYRIAVQGWTKEEALKEMIEGGFGFHGTRDGNVVQWVSRLNIDKIQRRAGIIEKASPDLAHRKDL